MRFALLAGLFLIMLNKCTETESLGAWSRITEFTLPLIQLVCCCALNYIHGFASFRAIYLSLSAVEMQVTESPGGSVRRGLLGVFLWAWVFPGYFLGGQRCGCVTKRDNVSSSQDLCAHCEIPLLLLSGRCSQEFEGHSSQGKCVYFSAEHKWNCSHSASLLLRITKTTFSTFLLNYFLRVSSTKDLSCVKCTFSPVWLKKH